MMKTTSRTLSRVAAMTMAVTTIVVALGLLGCTSAEPETPTQAIQEIIKLYESQDFESLIRTRYAEISKATNAQQVESLITRLPSKHL